MTGKNDCESATDVRGDRTMTVTGDGTITNPGTPTTTTPGTGPVRPECRLQAPTAYRVPRHPAPIDVCLDANEGPEPPVSLIDGLAPSLASIMNRYPSCADLERRLAAGLGLDADQVLVTAGADEAIERLCRAWLGPENEMICTTPTFEMIGRFGAMTGATVRTVAWFDGAFPTGEVIRSVNDATSLIAIVSPNNPTGCVIDHESLTRISEAAPGAVVLLDGAYQEFADVDLTAQALRLPNVVVTRTFSKALGLAGLRLGYAAGPKDLVEPLRRIGSPYSVSGLSAAIGQAALDDPGCRRAGYLDEVRRERAELAQTLGQLGAVVVVSQANFLLTRFPDPVWVAEALAGLGISVRSFPGKPDLKDWIRITIPGNRAVFDRLRDALATAVRPQAILFDMDGVLARETDSYRQSIIRTAATWGVTVTDEDVTAIKAAGNCNNDWVATRCLLEKAGVSVGLDEVTARFEAIYQGDAQTPGLWTTETLIPARTALSRLAGRLPLGVVTGRPRRDAVRFLESTSTADLFACVVCMEDAPLKPDPAPVRLAMERIGISRAWMVGDNPDDMTAARRAGVVPIGFLADGAHTGSGAAGLLRAGAARVIGSESQLEEIING